VERSYLLHIPPGLDNDQPAAVVIVFHGFGSDPKFMQAMTGFNDTSDTNGFLVAYPSGIGRSWNAGRCCGTAQTQNIDEPAFVQAMLEDIATIVRVDPKRVYATGFSNGGMLSYRLGCEMSGTFAAIAPVGGAMTYSPCEPQEPVSVFHVHAMNDADVRYEGGGFPSVEEGLKTWVSINECTDPAQTEEQLDGQLTHTTYASCRNDTAIELYAFKTGGHAWPSLYIWDASQFMWDFFATHPKP
jgi:polyhydroxybutyrate depolymerase